MTERRLEEEHEFEIPGEQLPDGFIRRIENPPASPAAARPAATLVLLRDGDHGPQVLLLRRTRRAGFVPGAYVFPGGTVDTVDADPRVLERVDGPTPDAAADRLGLRGGAPPAISYYVTALREAFEETGILVGKRSDGSRPRTAADDDGVRAVRDDLLEGRMELSQSLDRLGCRLQAGAIRYLAHWITPLVQPRRYDTRFFAARVGAHVEALVHPREMTDAVWLTPAEALRRRLEGSLPMVFPTIRTLRQLATYASAAEALADLEQREVPAITPRLVLTPTGVAMRAPERDP